MAYELFDADGQRDRHNEANSRSFANLRKSLKQTLIRTAYGTFT